MDFDNYKEICSLDQPSTLGSVGGKFLRLGIVGDWKKHFTLDIRKEWNAWINTEVKRFGLEGNRFKICN